MNTYSITKVIADANLANNGRLVALSMTEAQKRAAEKAVERGFMTKYHMNFPGFGFVATYAIV